MVLLALMPGLVTVAFPPTPLPKALESLSAAMGQRLECAPPLRDEVLIARLKDADGTRVLREVAECLDARWESQDDGLVLRPDPVAAARRGAAVRRAYEADVAASLKDIAARLAAQPAVFGPAQAAAYRKALEEFKKAAADDEEGPVANDEVYTEARPSWRAFARVVAALGARSFLALRPGERVVWSDRPTPMQLAFGPGAERAFAAFRREYALIAPKAAPARFRLVAASDEYRRGVLLQFDVLDPRGNSIADESDHLDGSTEEGADDVPEKPKTYREKPLAASDEEKEYFSLVNSRSTAVRDETFRRWEPRLADPVAFEPTRWFPGMALLAAAEAQGRNLIGVVPDAPGAKFGKTTDGQAPQAFLDLYSYLWTERDGWLVVRSTEDPPRLPRTAAGAFLRRSVERGGIEVDGAAEWAGRYPDGWIGISWLGDHLGALLSYGGMASASSTLMQDGLPVWAALSPAVRTALRKGAAIPLASLPATAQWAVRRKVYWEDAFEDDEREVTEALPNGIGEGVVSLRIAEEPVYMVWNAAGGEPVSRRPYTANAYGVKLAQDERRGMPGGFDRFRPGVTRRYTLHFEFPARGMEFDSLMSETLFDPKADVASRLPDAFLRQADVARKNLLARPVNPPPANAVP